MIPVIVWLVGIAATAFVAKKGIEQWGENKRNELTKQGVAPEDQYQEWQKYNQDRKKYVEEKADEHFKELNDRNKELQEENKTLNERLGKASDPQEKAQILEAIKENKKEIAQNNRDKAEFINKLNKQFGDFGRTPMTEQQFQAKATQPNLASWKNWGIIAFCVVIGLMLVSFLKKLLDKLRGSVD